MLKIISYRLAAEETLRVFLTPYMKSAVKEKEVFTQGESIQFSLNGHIIKGFRCNHPRKHKVLLLHGFSSSCHNFDKYVAPLIEKNYEVLAFDAPAHGASGGKTVNAVEYSEMIKKINECYGPINGFLAHSFGGIAISLAMENMIHDAGTKIVLIAPATETSSAVDGAFDLLGLKSDKLRKTFDDLILEKSGYHTSWFSIKRAFNNIKASVLWFHDEDDLVTPLKDALTVKEEGHPNVHFVISKGLGHRKIYRDDTVVQAAVKFL